MPDVTAWGVTDLDARPSVLLAALEGPRSFAELGALLSVGGLLALAPRGDGSPVVVLPGFTAGDSSTTSLRAVLRGLGHDVVGWGLGRNLGPTRAVLAGLERLLSTVADRHGAPVSLVGMSLGGIFARQPPRRARTRCGASSRWQPLPSDRPDQVNVDRAYRRRAHTHAEMPPAGSGPAARPLQVPTTSVYTRTDGIVPPGSCREPDTDLAQSVGVRAATAGWPTTRSSSTSSPTASRSPSATPRPSGRRPGCVRCTSSPVLDHLAAAQGESIALPRTVPPADARTLRRTRESAQHIGSLMRFRAPEGSPPDYLRNLLQELRDGLPVATPWNRSSPRRAAVQPAAHAGRGQGLRLRLPRTPHCRPRPG